MQSRRFHGLRKRALWGGGNCSAYHSRETSLELVRLELIYSFLQLHSWEIEAWGATFMMHHWVLNASNACLIFMTALWSGHFYVPNLMIRKPRLMADKPALCQPPLCHRAGTWQSWESHTSRCQRAQPIHTLPTTYRMLGGCSSVTDRRFPAWCSFSVIPFCQLTFSSSDGAIIHFPEVPFSRKIAVSLVFQAFSTFVTPDCLL